jgi:transcriptional regulator with XRE-family HTH domain
MIGKIIKYIRVSQNLTQTDLAKKLHIGRSTLSDYEREKTDISFETLEKLAQMCGFRIVFISNKTQEEIHSENIHRKDIQYEQVEKV